MMYIFIQFAYLCDKKYIKFCETFPNMFSSLLSLSPGTETVWYWLANLGANNVCRMLPDLMLGGLGPGLSFKAI